MDEHFGQLAQTRTVGAASRRAVMAGLLGAGLVLAASGTVLAAGKMGGSAEGLGGWQISCHEEVPDGDSAAETDGPERLGGKIGVAGGDD
jgi:hypothetical protein